MRAIQYFFLGLCKQKFQVVMEKALPASLPLCLAQASKGKPGLLWMLITHQGLCFPGTDREQSSSYLSLELPAHYLCAF